MKNIYLLFSLFSICAFSQTSNDNFNNFLKDEQVINAQVSLKIVRNEGEKINEHNKSQGSEINYNANKLMYPASLQKLVTSKIALDVLGADFKYETKVNFNGIVEGTTFKGVIEVIGSGDPSLDESLVNEIYEFLVSKKINKIVGYIEVIQEVFDDNAPQSWLVEDVANYYGAVSYSFNYKMNLYRIKLKQAAFGKSPTLVSTIPAQKKIEFENQLISTEADAPDKAYVLGMSFSNKRRIVGSIPSGTGFFIIKGSDNNPAQTFKNELIKKFQDKQFSFVFNANINSINTVLTFTHSSHKLADLLKAMNQRSINFYAEAILKTIALKEYGAPGTSENGRKAIEAKVGSEQYHFYDGSGMSRKNLWNADLLIDFLSEYANQSSSNNSQVFKNSLGVSGVSGTMKYFNSENIRDKVFGKSGSADGVLNYAGYFTDNNDIEHSFVFMINNYTGDRKVLRRKMVKVLEDFIVQ